MRGGVYAGTAHRTIAAETIRSTAVPPRTAPTVQYGNSQKPLPNAPTHPPRVETALTTPYTRPVSPAAVTTNRTTRGVAAPRAAKGTNKSNDAPASAPARSPNPVIAGNRNSRTGRTANNQRAAPTNNQEREERGFSRSASHPPNAAPTAKAARVVVMRADQVVTDVPKYGESRIEPSDSRIRTTAPIKKITA